MHETTLPLRQIDTMPKDKAGFEYGGVPSSRYGPDGSANQDYNPPPRESKVRDFAYEPAKEETKPSDDKKSSSSAGKKPKTSAK